MSLATLKTKNQGFTIVELLIVVVVIAILAAITIISYAGITARANESAVKLQASNFQKKAEAYNAEVGNYPEAIAKLTADSSKSYYWSDTNVSYNYGTPTTAALPNDSNVTKRLIVQPCGNASLAALVASPSSVTGLVIWFYNPNAKAVQSVSDGATTTCATAA